MKEKKKKGGWDGGYFPFFKLKFLVLCLMIYTILGLDLLFIYLLKLSFSFEI